MISYHDIITIEPGKRGGQPGILGMRITPYDMSSYLASGMSESDQDASGVRNHETSQTTSAIATSTAISTFFIVPSDQASAPRLMIHD